MKIREDCFAIVIPTGHLVYVRRHSDYSTAWETTGGDFREYELRLVGADTPLYNLLQSGADIRYEGGAWSIH